MSTKTQSHEKTRPTKPSRYEEILRCLKTKGPQTDPELEENLQMIRSSLTARLAELQAAGRVIVVGETFNERTDRNINIYGLASLTDSLTFTKPKSTPKSDVDFTLLAADYENLQKKMAIAISFLVYLNQQNLTLDKFVTDFIADGQKCLKN